MIDTFLKRLRTALRQMFCMHSWQMLGIQPFFGMPYQAQRCIHCGKQRRAMELYISTSAREVR